MKKLIITTLLLTTNAQALDINPEPKPCTTAGSCWQNQADRDNPPKEGPITPAPPMAIPDGKGGVIFVDQISPAPVISEVDTLKHQVKRLKVKVIKLTAENIKLTKRLRRGR